MSDAASRRATTTCSRWTTRWWCRWTKKIRIITTADDVIHAWMVPSLGVKQDAIPGFVRDTWFRAEKTGDFYGQCAELCGKEHAYMPIHVKVLSQADYTKWVEGKKKEAGGRGRRSDQGLEACPSWWPAARRCTPPTARPATRPERQRRRPDQAARRLAGRAVDADKAKQIAVLLNGQNNGAMPAWKQLSDTELAAVITYTKNSWSNKTGQVVQPAEVRAAAQVTRIEYSRRSYARNPHERSHSTTCGHAHDHDHHDHEHHPTGWRAGCTRRTTRTSARCTCCSASPC